MRHPLLPSSPMRSSYLTQCHVPATLIHMTELLVSAARRRARPLEEGLQVWVWADGRRIEIEMCLQAMSHPVRRLAAPSPILPHLPAAACYSSGANAVQRSVSVRLIHTACGVVKRTACHCPAPWESFRTVQRSACPSHCLGPQPWPASSVHASLQTKGLDQPAMRFWSVGAAVRPGHSP